MKIGLNLIAAFCPNTPVNHRTFAPAIGVIRGQIQITQPMLLANGFVYAKDVQEISRSVKEHSFRLVHLDGAWHVFSSFFGGSIGAYVALAGPNKEEWSRADIVAPIKSKDWTVSLSRILPIMKHRVEWRNSEEVMPFVKMQKYVTMLRAELVRRK
jgi:hypothetical protein